MRGENQAFVDLMIPVVKGWSTESAVLVTSLGVQIHGGMGYIEETGASQHLRDARITPIYEGTIGIQAADLIGRKIARDGGQAIGAVLQQMGTVRAQLAESGDVNLEAIAQRLQAAISALRDAVDFVVAKQGSEAPLAAAGAVPLLELFGIATGGWQLGRAALAAHRLLQDGSGAGDFLKAKQLTARFYADHVLSAAPGLAQAVLHGGGATLDYPDDAF